MCAELKELRREAGGKTPSELAWRAWIENTTPYAKTQLAGKKAFTYEFRRYGQAIAQIEPTGNYLLISKLEALETGRGAATRLIGFLKCLSDEYQVRLFARAVAYRPGFPVPTGHLLSQTELQGWYGRLGFQVWPINLQSADIGYPDLPTA